MVQLGLWLCKNLVNLPLKAQAPGHAMDHWTQLRHIAWDNNSECFYLHMKAAQVMGIIYFWGNLFTCTARSTNESKNPGKSGNGGMNRPVHCYKWTWAVWAAEQIITHFFLSDSKPFHWSTLQKNTSRTLTFLEEVLDYKKTPALILTASSFQWRKKRVPVSQYALMLHENLIAVSALLAARINYHAGNSTFQLESNSNPLEMLYLQHI